MYPIARGVFVVLGIGLVVAIAPAHAVGSDTIYSPRVEQGEWELEYKGRYFYDRDSDEHRQSQSKMALGYGPTSYWWTELYAEYEHTPGNGGGWSAFEWENRFQFTEPGQYWMDVGALVELERTHPGAGKEARIGLLLEKDIGETTLTVNWLLGRTFADQASSHWEQEYRAQWAWRCRPEAQPLVQWQGDEHSAYVGPGISGKTRIATQHVGYHLAWLRRISGEVPKSTLRVELEFEF
ncbi:MAG: hypothetical protein ABI900_13775 [Betaproteobacteria bacterium]